VNPEEFFNSLVDYEKIPGYDYKLEDFIEFLTQFDSPQKRLNNVIHIAGTKGKGSTAAMISSCLETSGYRVGLFTSPHLKRINERIKINNIEISNHQLNKYIKEIKPYINMKTPVGARPVKYRKSSGASPIKQHEFHGARTYFEVLTTIAFLHFLKEKTDFTILEVGLGGRLDSTNVTHPIISVITKIGYDHTNLLGNKLSQITREKAGIIKPPPFPPPQVDILKNSHFPGSRAFRLALLNTICRRKFKHSWCCYLTGLVKYGVQRLPRQFINIQGVPSLHAMSEDIALPKYGRKRLPVRRTQTDPTPENRQPRKRDKTMYSQLITIHQRSSVEQIIKRVAKKQRNKITFGESQHDIKIVRQTIKGSYLKIKGETGKYDTFLPLPGKHQVENLLIALAVINELGKMGFKIPIPAIQKGIRQIDLRGRFEIISPKSLVPYFRESTQSGTLRERTKRPLIIFDCAHNQDSFEALEKNLNLINTKDLYLIFGTNKDKDIRYCLKYIFPKAKEVLLVKANNPRAMEPIDLYKRAKKYQKNLTIVSSVKNGIEYLKTKAGNNSVIIITGSFYLWPEIPN
jgi:folylpolyglutamate synthase/dihydropteroate synthase